VPVVPVVVCIVVWLPQMQKLSALQGHIPGGRTVHAAVQAALVLPNLTPSSVATQLKPVELLVVLVEDCCVLAGVVLVSVRLVCTVVVVVVVEVVSAIVVVCTVSAVVVAAGVVCVPVSVVPPWVPQEPPPSLIKLMRG